MKPLDVLVAIFATYMLVRHLPRVVALLRGRAPDQPRAMAVVSLVNVALAVALLVFAVKGLVTRLAAP